MKKIFSKEFYKSSLSHFYNVKSICLMGIFIALMTVIGGLCSQNPIKVFGRTVSLIFIFWPLMGILFGPIPATVIAVVVDLLSFFLFPTGYPFYIGYLLSEALVAFVSGLVFYKSNISIIKLILFEFFLDIIVHVGIESIFMNDISAWNFGEAYTAYVIKGLIKNLILWPVETIILTLALSSLLPVFKNLKLIDDDVSKKVIFIFKNKKEEDE